MMCKLLPMIFLLVHLLLYKNTMAIQEIRFEGSLVLNTNHETGIKKTVLSNEPLNLVFVNSTGISQFKCMEAVTTYGGFTVNTKDYYLENGSSTTIKIFNITNNMSTKWRCSALVSSKGRIYGSYDAAMDYLFEVKVMSAKIVNVTVNGMDLVFKNATLAESEYDGIYEYQSVEGAYVELKCSNAYEDYGNVALLYYDAHDNLTVNTINEEEPFRFQQIMRSENHQSYIDCIYFSPLSHQEFKYRTVFLITIETSRKRDAVVTINNMKLTPMNNSRGAVDMYHYNFSYGEVLVVACDNDRHLPRDGAIELTFNNISGYSVKAQTNELTVDPKGYDLAHLRCLSKDDVMAEVLFNRDIERDPVIIGFPVNDLLYQYKKNKETWEAHYIYSEDKDIKLRCVTTPDKVLTWHVESNPATPIFTTKKVVDEFEAYVEANFTFNAGHTEIRIICEASKSGTKTRAVTVLHLKPGIKNTDFGIKDQRTFEMIAVCLVVILLISILTLYVFYRRSRNMITATTEKPFTNFRANTNPMSSPVQAESNEYTYITNENIIHNNIQPDVMKNNSVYFENKQVYDITEIKPDNTAIEHQYTEINDINTQKNAKEMYSKPNNRRTNQLYSEPYDHCLKKVDNIQKTYNEPYAHGSFKNDAPNNETSPDYSNVKGENSDVNCRNLSSKDEGLITCKTKIIKIEKTVTY